MSAIIRQACFQWRSAKKREANGCLHRSGRGRGNATLPGNEAAHNEFHVKDDARSQKQEIDTGK